MPRAQRLLLILAILRFILPYFLQNAAYLPHRDEYLYLAEGQHPGWGYMEVPPFLSVFAWLTHVLGNSFFWIKFWPSLFGSLTFWLTGRIVLSMGGKTFALLLAWLPFAVDGYARLFFLFMPNFLDVFFWTLMAYCLIRYVRTNSNKWIYGWGIAAGLGMMSKYSAAFYILSLLTGLLLSPHRKIFLQRSFYRSCGIALLIFLPNLIWQYEHRFPVVYHMTELEDTQLKFIHAGDFIMNQFMMIFPCVYVWLYGLFYLLLAKILRPYRFLAVAYLVVIILLLLLHGKAYYTLGSYPVLFAFGAQGLENFAQNRLRWLRYVLLSFSIALSLFALPLVLPVFRPAKLVRYYETTGLNKTGDFFWEDLKRHPLPQDFADMIGWKELTEKTARVFHSLPPAEQSNTGIYCRGYFTAGALNYYGPQYGLPEAFSDDASFLLWMPDSPAIKNLLLIGHHVPEKDDIVFQQFEKMTIKDTLNMPLFRENGMKMILFENGNDSLGYYLKTGIAGLKARFRR